MEDMLCTHLERCLEKLATIKQGMSLEVRLNENSKIPCLHISCIKSHSGFTCSFQEEERLFFLVEDSLRENQSFLVYTEKKLAPEQMLISMDAVQSTVEKFYEYQGDIQQCVEWIMENP